MHTEACEAALVQTEAWRLHLCKLRLGRLHLCKLKLERLYLCGQRLGILPHMAAETSKHDNASFRRLQMQCVQKT